jgi:hypothetical protein
MSSKIKRLLTWVAIATAAGLKATPLAEGLKNEPASQKIQGTIRLVTQRVNPADRLIDVFVSMGVLAYFQRPHCRSQADRYAPAPPSPYKEHKMKGTVLIVDDEKRCASR